jgi:hypothetical protein
MKRDAVISWMATELNHGPREATTMLFLGECLGFSRSSIYRAKMALGAQSTKKGLRGAWYWKLIEREANG